MGGGRASRRRTASTGWVTPIELPTWAAAKEQLRQLSGWMFRGQSDATWELATTLERCVAEPSQRPLDEAWLLSQFQAMAANYLEAAQLPTARLDWLALMQHHGCPTRLLDFTLSPYVAAYIAFEPERQIPVRAIWAIDRAWCLETAGRRLIRSSSPPRDALGYMRAALEWLEAPDWRPFAGVVPAEPFRLSIRQSLQQAMFLVPGDVTQPFIANLKMLSPDNKAILRRHVRCYLLPSELRPEVLNDLHLMNINRASLFPGLDGFAQSLKYRLLREPPEERALRIVLEAPRRKG